MKTKFILLCFIIPIFIKLDLIAQPSSGINYQGVARDSVGHPLINQGISLRLSILDSVSTGITVYVETQNVITNGFGLFNLNIGNGIVVSGVFADIQWGQNNKWLKIEMDAAGGNNYQLIGVSQFMSVPYALYSKNGFSGNALSGDMLYYNGSTWVSISEGSYGQTLTFCNGVPTWGGCLPLITTNSMSNISKGTAIAGGNISNDGGAPIIQRGVCWGTNTGPTISLNTKTIDGSGAGSFISSLSGLTPGATYYLRAYATNNVGTAYGNEVVFTLFVAANLPSISICNQVWTTENLSLNIYRNGDTIPHVTDASQWENITYGAWCWYNNDSATYASTYGKLYNWFAVNDPRGLAPIGWHIPTNAEWTTLSNCLGGDAVAGGKMKETGTTHWLPPNFGATNISGFTALPGGFRYNTGTSGVFSVGIGNSCIWWSTTEQNIIYAWGRNIVYSDSNFNISGGNEKQSGFSVRCLRD